MTSPKHLFCFGTGFSAIWLANILTQKGWHISGTFRHEDKKAHIEQAGITSIRFNDTLTLPKSTTHILLSIPPNDNGDIIYQQYLSQIQELTQLEWIGYFSTTGVYGDHQGNWVDETTPTAPLTLPAKRRVIAEQQWLTSNLPIHIFRLAGIYGPGRSAIEQLRQGTAKRIDKPQQVFSRIHVADIANIVSASINAPSPGSIYNCADDMPEAQHKVVSYAAKLLNIPAPKLIPFSQAQLSPMAQHFYSCNRRITNNKIKEELNITLQYPNYKIGLASILAEKQAKNT